MENFLQLRLILGLAISIFTTFSKSIRQRYSFLLSNSQFLCYLKCSKLLIQYLLIEEPRRSGKRKISCYPLGRYNPIQRPRHNWHMIIYRRRNRRARPSRCPAIDLVARAEPALYTGLPASRNF